MSKIFTMRHGVLLFMGLGITFTAFAPDMGAYSTYVKDGAAAAMGLAALFMHPPTLSGDPAASNTDATTAAVVPGKP